MLDYQQEQGNKRDINVFEKSKFSPLYVGGFAWNITKEKYIFWYEVISYKNFNLFFEKYPKQDNQYNSQGFKVGDEVIDIISSRRGRVTKIDTLNNDSYSIFVKFNDEEVASFTLDGRHYSIDKYPRLLHYRDDYDYSVIDFNNLPKRQEANRWRAKKGELYYIIYLEGMGFGRGANLDKYNEDDNDYYEYGNYFKTDEEAQEIADKLNRYFKQLINTKK